MPRPFRIFLNIYFVLVFVGIGGLQMYRVNAGLLTNYGADLLAPPYLYFAFRFRWSPLLSLLVVLGGCYAWEGLQRFDLTGTPFAITRGAFDPLDLVAYSIGVLVAYIVDRRWLGPNGMLPSHTAT